MGLVPNLEYMGISTKSLKVFLMLKSMYTKNGIELL